MESQKGSVEGVLGTEAWVRPGSYKESQLLLLSAEMRTRGNASQLSLLLKPNGNKLLMVYPSPVSKLNHLLPSPIPANPSNCGVRMDLGM